ncbi:hypothetical protein EJ07DRAFT_140267, partial [Lizonia empirigonia]
RAPARPLPRGSEFLIVGLFALRLTKTLIEGLPQYPERYGDLAWLAHMLAPFPIDYDLAKLTGEGKRDYLRTYPAVVSRMKRQPGYPLRFMQMNPATVARLDVLHRQGGMTDAQRTEMIDFADAALEWGSVVRLPASELRRMVGQANQRRIAVVNHIDPAQAW